MSALSSLIKQNQNSLQSVNAAGSLSLPIFKITCLSKIKLKKMRKIERFVDGITMMSILPLAWHAGELLPSFDNHFATIKITSTKALSFSLYSAFSVHAMELGGRWRGRGSFKAILITISIHVFIDNWSLIYSLFAFTAEHLISRYISGRQLSINGKQYWDAN